MRVPSKNPAGHHVIVDDCMELMAHAPDDSVDLIFADPPLTFNRKAIAVAHPIAKLLRTSKMTHFGSC